MNICTVAKLCNDACENVNVHLGGWAGGLGGEVFLSVLF